MPAGIRPTQAIVCKSLFDILGQDLEGVMFLDMFAGSGSIGLEALSRGAKFCLFVEKDYKCVKVIANNLSLLNIEGYDILNRDGLAAIKHLAKEKQQFDMIFLDPPYDRGLVKKALKILDGYGIVHPNSTLVIQHDKNEPLPEVTGRFSCFKQRKFGATILSFYKPL